ncbi:HD domain-containing protein [Sporolactobacillus laevolacticus]|uniref:HD domain-containing protein n=1 Tax=Sporolactobacillus laevolacticus TaxID=33018 RepID=UPI0025B455C0|nr:HD domain-containing protein [Sporolactobacillus laevolacticus]MDN3956060.1 HD domain-containing protein [Sporolactobacillus laevolacticus]
MLPNKETAENELERAGQLNPGPWTEHSINVGLAAKYIAEKCPNMDADKAYIFGVLHDIGRRVGIVNVPKHVYEGYVYTMEKGWDEAAKICMTHSYPIKEKDFAEEVQGEGEIIKDYIVNCTYDDYDRLLQLCDSLALANGFCMLEKRFIDVARRYGVGSTSVPRWNATFEIKEFFEKQMGCSIYDVLPKIKDTTFMDIPVWNPPIN